MTDLNKTPSKRIRSDRADRPEREGGGRNSFDRDFQGDEMDGMDKDRKVFARKRSCWFCEKKTDPDWKNPASYGWLISEFGKISAGRISGICSGHQRMATTAVKRARSIGLISYVSSFVAH